VSHFHGDGAMKNFSSDFNVGLKHFAALFDSTVRLAGWLWLHACRDFFMCRYNRQK